MAKVLLWNRILND